MMGAENVRLNDLGQSGKVSAAGVTLRSAIVPGSVQGNVENPNSPKGIKL